jgi:hypothetical protein
VLAASINAARVSFEIVSAHGGRGSCTSGACSVCWSVLPDYAPAGMEVSGLRGSANCVNLSSMVSSICLCSSWLLSLTVTC